MDVYALNVVSILIFLQLLDDYPHPTCFKLLKQRLQEGPLKHETNANICGLVDKIKNKFKNKRFRKNKFKEKSINTKSLSRAISTRKFLKNVKFDIDESDFKNYSELDRCMYNKYLNHEGKNCYVKINGYRSHRE